jgi:NADH-quinone oxidoreductase subunit G
MPRPQKNTITLSIDGREIEATEGAMLVDAAKEGDVEIPFFCYEKKLGGPVGACRMCLVEIEGIPKLQTSCSTPVKDGMVVHTQTDRVREAQNAVVEFLLINHPLDCPVCDKGGECPLQDITFGWGRGISRMIEPKRHFQKPLALSPLVAIDRERCILCYRCVRFSQEVAEDYQLIFTERGAHAFVGTHDGRPYVAPFSGNIIELCPVGALTSQPYRFRARPWDIEAAGSVCTLCPAQCNVSFTVRDERVMRVEARDHDGVDDGWLCDKGRFAYQAIHSDQRITRPLVRDGGELREVSWERAMETARGLAKHPGRVAALLGGGTSNEEGFLVQRILREGLQSDDIDSRGGGEIPNGLARALAAPELQASVPDIEFAHTVLLLGVDPLEDAPILDLRIRKGVRRNGVNLVVATARPTHLERNATHIARYAPGQETDFLDALHRTLAGEDDPTRPVGQTVTALATQLREGGEDVVILYSERLAPAAVALLAQIATRLGLGDREGAGLLAIPVAANGRGLREAGAVPDAGPGYAPLADGRGGRSAAEIAQAAADGEVTALWLVQTDPVRDLENRDLWNRALHSAGLVVAHASVLTEGLREHASVIFPAESYAEKAGTIVHPDGRLQRLRVSIRHPGEVHPEWHTIAEIGQACGVDITARRSEDVFDEIVAAVPFYGGITLDGLGGVGLRWQEGAAASALAPEDPAAAITGARVPPTAPAATNGHLALGTYRPLWAAPEVEISPALQYLVSRQSIELSPADASLRGIADGEEVVVSQNGTRLPATAIIRSTVPDGAAFLAQGIADGNANVLTEPLIEVVKVR